MQFSKILPAIIEAGSVALDYYQTQVSRKQKADYSPVTEADEAVEQFLIEKINEIYADEPFAIIGEESEHHASASNEFIWVIDPIDGTRVFINGLPTWNISVGLLQHGKTYRGAVYLPVLDELYYTTDEGCALWRNRMHRAEGRPLAGMMQQQIGRDGFLGISSGAHHKFNIDFARVRSLGAIATHQVYVARGAALAALHSESSIWDVAGAQAILTAVGGAAYYLDGERVSILEMLRLGKVKRPMLVGHPQMIETFLPRITLI